MAAAFLAVTWLFAAAGIALWAAQVPAAHVRVAAAAGLLAAAALIAWRGWLLSPRGMLGWDGAEWRWTAAAKAEAGTPEAALDLQSLLLLRWKSGIGGRRWLWAEKRAQPATWDDLRRAVYSRAPKT